MNTSTNHLNLRIVVGSVLIGLFIIAISAYSTYSEDIKKGVAEKVVELLPDLDNSLAKL